MRKTLKPFVLLLLAIEFLDELVFGIREAAWPLIRDDLALNYVQVGMLLSLPALISSLVEPAIGILGDTWKRGLLILAGGIVFAVALALTAVSPGFGLLLFSFILFYPASGAFVSLSQASLMDSEPDRHEKNMARWTFAGSLGVVAGPLVLGAAVWIGAGWRGTYAAAAVIALLLAASARRFVFRAPQKAEGTDGVGQAFGAGVRAALQALRRRQVLRWLVLLEFSDLMLDVLLGFLALYMVDVAGATALEAGIAVGVWLSVGLLGDFLLIPLLERVRGLVYLRVSVIVELILFPVFLLAPSYTLKLVALALLGLFNAGWYAILKGQLYSAMPGQSGTVMAVNNIAGLAWTLVPLAIGAAAQAFGLAAAMWILLAGPIALSVGINGRIVAKADETDRPPPLDR